MVLTMPVLHAAVKRGGHAGILPHSIWNHLPDPKATFEVRHPALAPFRYAPVKGDLVARTLYWGGAAAYEPETIGVFIDLALHSRVILDVGAYTGLFALIAAASGKDRSVYAFEPVPRIYECLLRNVQVSEFADRVKLFNVAVSDTQGSVSFHVPAKAMPTSASMNVEGFRGHKGELIEVPAKTVDECVPEDVKVDLIKLDVEGFEDKALAGMQRILQNSRPTLIVECLPGGPYESVDATLRQLGYEAYHLVPSGPRRVECVVPDQADQYRNFLFRPTS